MAYVHETAVSLRFSGDDLDPDYITRVLGVAPTQGVQQGGAWMHPNGRARIIRTGRWLLTTPRESPGDLDKQVAELFAPLSMDLNAWRSLSSRFGGNLFVGMFLAGSNEGLGISPATSAAIGLRGLELELDIYSGQDPDDMDEA